MKNDQPQTRIIGGKFYSRQEDGSYSLAQAMASKSQASKPEQTLCNESLAAPRIPGCSKKRILLRISQFTRRRQDPDNCCPKYEIDALRELKVISDDTDDDVEIQISQIQVGKQEDEGVLIEIL